MRRVKRLGNVTFWQTIFTNEETQSTKVQAKARRCSDGSLVVYEQKIKPYIILDTGSNGWIDDEQRSQIVEMFNEMGTTYELEYDDGSTITVRPAREKKLNLKPIFEGAGEFLGTIPLAVI